MAFSSAVSAKKPAEKEPSPDDLRRMKSLKVNMASCGVLRDPPPPKKSWAVAALVASINHKSDPVVDILPNHKNIDVRLPIGSIAKTMTAFHVFEAMEEGRLKPDDYIPITPDMFCLPSNKFSAESLPPGINRIRVDEGLAHMLRTSNNTIAEAFARFLGNSPEAFVTKMNGLATKWGAKNTNFVTPHGLPPQNRSSEYTTARDFAVIAAHLVKHDEKFMKYESYPLTVDGVYYLPEGTTYKQRFIEAGVRLKTASTAACYSFVAWVQLQEKFQFAAKFCEPNAKLRRDEISILTARMESTGRIFKP